MPAIASFANPMQFLCSAIQAGSRLGYQDSAELCAQYLAPILDAIKFNYPPFGVNQVSTAETLPKYVAYSEPRLQPPPGYKDTTVPGIWSRDTLFSHGNHEPGWMDRRARHAGRRRAAVHREHAHPGVARRADGWPGHRRPSRRPARQEARRRILQREQPASAAVVPAAPIRRRRPGPDVVPGPLPVSQQINAGGTGPAPAAAAPAGPALPAEMGTGQ